MNTIGFLDLSGFADRISFLETSIPADAVVPGSVITAVIIVACAVIGLPVLLAILGRIRLKGTIISALWGVLTFVVFAMILESGINLLVQKYVGDITSNIWFYAIYGGLAAGVFEETGRFVVMKFIMKDTLNKQNAIMHGIGHGGIESIMLVGLTYVSNLAISLAINAGEFDSMLDGLDDTMKAQTIEQYSALWTTSAGMFYLAIVERIAAIAFHICMSYIVYRAVKDKNPRYYLLAVGLHFAYDAGMVLLAGVVPIVILEVILLVFSAAVSVMVYKAYRGEKDVVSV